MFERVTFKGFFKRSLVNWKDFVETAILPQRRRASSQDSSTPDINLKKKQKNIFRDLPLEENYPIDSRHMSYVYTFNNDFFYCTHMDPI